MGTLGSLNAHCALRILANTTCNWVISQVLGISICEPAYNWYVLT